MPYIKKATPYMKKGHALYKKVTPYIKTQHLICLNDVMNFTTTKRRLRYKCFWSNFFILFYFISVNWIIISCFISYFSLKYKKFELLVAFRPGNFGEVKGFLQKQCVKNYVFLSPFLLLKSLLPPLQTLPTHFPPNNNGHAQLSNNTG